MYASLIGGAAVVAVCIVLAALLIRGSGTDDAEASEARTEGPTAIDEACAAIGSQLPEAPRTIYGWQRALDEAEHYRESDDPTVRDFARDLAELLEPMVDADENGVTQAGLNDLVATYQERWDVVSAPCGWG